MKFTSTLLMLLPGVMSSPTRRTSSTLALRETIEEVTDELLFTLTLPQFTARRNAQDPSTLDWTSDGCTDSPDNPFGFPFVPACNRHDFGYQNYRAQTRFTVSAKAKIDSNFKTEYVKVPLTVVTKANMMLVSTISASLLPPRLCVMLWQMSTMLPSGLLEAKMLLLERETRT